MDFRIGNFGRTAQNSAERHPQMIYIFTIAQVLPGDKDQPKKKPAGRNPFPPAGPDIQAIFYISDSLLWYMIKRMAARSDAIQNQMARSANRLQHSTPRAAPPRNTRSIQ